MTKVAAMPIQPAPIIAPVPEGIPRPLWSVMIPVRNRLDYLEQCLRSVLDQAPSADEMQIEIVDNSTKDIGTEAFVSKIANGRVVYFRQPRDLGMAENWNSCIARARAHFIHILHDDDFVEPEFYRGMARAADANPANGVIACRCFLVDETGKRRGFSEPAPAFKCGTNFDASSLYYKDLFRTPGVVFQRTAAEKCGGFRDFGHVSDWEMWLRLIRFTGCSFVDTPLASYRESAANLTHQTQRHAIPFVSSLQMAHILAEEIPDFDLGRFRRQLGFWAKDAAFSYARYGDWEAARNNMLFARQVDSRLQDLLSPAVFAFIALQRGFEGLLRRLKKREIPNAVGKEVDQFTRVGADD